MKLRDFLLVSFVLSVLWSTSIFAAFQCTGSPGEYQVGVAKDANGNPLGPLCESSYKGDGQQPIQYRMIDSYIAVAQHFDANDVWVAWNHRTAQEATKAALDACNKVMGSGCMIFGGDAGRNISVAVVDDVGIINNLGWGKTPEEANKAGLGKCAERGTRCKVRHTFTASPWKDTPLNLVFKGNSKNYFPDQKVPRITYVMVGWPKSDPGTQWHGKSWLTSGKGSEESKQVLLDRCKQDTRVECEVALLVPNGTVTSYIKNKSANITFMGGPTQKDAEGYIKAYCAKESAECVIGQSYDSKTPRLEVVSKP